MFKRTNFFAALAISSALAFPVTAQDVTADTVLATVNGTNITLGHMIIMRDALPAQYDNLEDDVLFDALLDQAVQQLVLAQTVDTPSRAVQLRLENERWTLLAGAAMSIEINKAVTEEALQAAYDEQFAGVDPAQEYNASHILVETEEEATALVTELQGGASFGGLAKEHSTGPSGPNGGELGWFGAGMMVAPFEEAVVLLEVGQVSAPVQTQFGWHVIILNETRLLDAPTLDDVRTDLTAELEQQAIEIVIENLTKTADVTRLDSTEIDPAILRDTSLVQN